MKKRLSGWIAEGRGVATHARGWVAERGVALSVAISLFGLGAGVVVTAVDPGWVGGGESGSTTIRNLGIVLAGLVALPLTVWRGVVANRQADTAQQDLLNKRYQDSAGMLGSDVLVVRLAGIYALRSLAEEHPAEYHKRVMRLLCAFVRHRAGNPGDNAALGVRDKRSRIAPRRLDDVHEAITAVSVCHEKQIDTDVACGLDLRGADLSGAFLPRVYLPSPPDPDAPGFSDPGHGPLVEALNISSVNLGAANLSRAVLGKARLRGTILVGQI